MTGKKERIWHDPPMPGEIVPTTPMTKQFIMSEQDFRKMLEDSRNLTAFFNEIKRHEKQLLVFNAAFNAFVTAVFLIILPYLGVTIDEMVRFFLLAGVGFILIGIIFYSNFKPPKNIT